MNGLPVSGFIPTVAEVERIAAVSDPVIRNLQITQCYHELAVALTTRTGICANWCTFATWASKQAGQTIRQEDLVRVFDERFCASAEVAAVLDSIAQNLKRAGAELRARAPGHSSST